MTFSLLYLWHTNVFPFVSLQSIDFHMKRNNISIKRAKSLLYQSKHVPNVRIVVMFFYFKTIYHSFIDYAEMKTTEK